MALFEPIFESLNRVEASTWAVVDDALTWIHRPFELKWSGRFMRS